MSYPPPKRDSTMTPEKVEATWQSPSSTKCLGINWNRCIGCNLCVISCPTAALSLGPIPSIATGAVKAPPLLLDASKCTFCGICESICPVKAISFNYRNEKIIQRPDYPKLCGQTLIKDNCIPCFVCQKACPTQALNAQIQLPKKQDLVTYPGESSPCTGSITINKTKCTYCGLCELLCDAIAITWTISTPEHPIPAEEIRVVLSKCDYCDLCSQICPSDAINVTCDSHPPRSINEVKIQGSLSHDLSKCIHCGVCRTVCPVEAIEVHRPYEGTIEIHDLPRCDPVGCKACINICPTKAWYIPKNPEIRVTKKIAVDEQRCVLCGACAQACPEHLIIIKRTDPCISDAPPRPWAKSRISRLKAAVAGVSLSPLENKYLKSAKVQDPAPEKKEHHACTPDSHLFEEAQEKLTALESSLQNVRTRRTIEQTSSSHIQDNPPKRDSLPRS